jgi:hypothetical protein
MAKCKYCEEPIKWERDKEADGERRWIPIDPDNGERHECSEFEKDDEQEEAVIKPQQNLPTCKYCNKEISFKQVVVSEEDQELKWIPYSADGKQPHDCKERKEAWRAEQSQRTGRSQAALCKNGCGTLVFWNYDLRSKLNKKPLPYEQATNAYHSCPKYNPRRR